MNSRRRSPHSANGQIQVPFARSARSRINRNGASRKRAGRVLVECIVGMFLLAVVALSTAVASHDTLSLADDSLLIAGGEALAVSHAEDALLAPCATSANGNGVRPRVDVAWQLNGSTAASRTHVDVTLQRSPLARGGLGAMTFVIDGGGVCP